MPMGYVGTTGILSWPEAQAAGMSPEAWSAQLPVGQTYAPFSNVELLAGGGFLSSLNGQGVITPDIDAAIRNAQAATSAISIGLVEDVISGVVSGALEGGGDSGPGVGLQINGADVPLVGPGVKEPPNYMVKKRWETRVYDNQLGYIKLNFYALTNGYIAMYHNYRKYWKVWKPKKHIVISKNPRISNIMKLDRTYRKVMKLLAKSKALKRA